ncbi:shikimate kinase AroL [Pseudodesulfovibrio sediminis]|uniref:Shikimate kinase n=1 Tax=Pseudodesulfovibrio sediminis TaxID=2810563 RepID=A0ABM7P417_9BACT|nr:shikimate kinase AroL [Pseudodesulfovibrio sediminis]BCS87595.1 shikimate kinase [Pseudodesulfovibrio sediminis]
MSTQRLKMAQNSTTVPVMAAKNIFLIGPRACGKTSVGRKLAERLGVDFVDTDHALVQAVGMEIADYVEQNGWEAFRDREVETLVREATPGGRVIGCGGGIILREENRAVLASGVTLYLKAEAEELARRLMNDPNEAQRPSLTGKSVVDEVREILDARAHLYEGCADAALEGASLAEIVTLAVQAVDRLS